MEEIEKRFVELGGNNGEKPCGSAEKDGGKKGL